ncbi:hypothetical protein HanIR_Chr02g0067961 [Helianthus annuus]|nr:hypothetical protein HanIR_Chr02g0067961 [Helianthus annuus]
MSSSESSGLSDEHDPMAIVSDDEPFALPDFGDDAPFADDVLALPLPLHDQLIIGHPDGEHVVEPIPIHVIPLAAILAEDWPFVVDLDDDVDVFVIEVEHFDDDLSDGEVYDIAILDVASPVVSVIDISSDSDPKSDADSFESVTSSALLAARLEAYPAADDDDTVLVAPATPIRAPTPAGTPPHTLVRAATSSSQPPAPAGQFSCSRSVRYASAFHHTPPTHGGEPSSHPHILPPDSDQCHQSPRLFPLYSMLLSDPYHPSYHSGYTRDDLLLSLQLQVEILCHMVCELESEADARRPPPPAYPPPVIPPPPPPSSPPPVSPPPVHVPVDGHAVRFLTLEQQVNF